MQEQETFDDTEAPPIKYLLDGRQSKAWTEWNFFVNRKSKEVNNPEPDWRDAYKQDYLIQNPQ